MTVDDEFRLGILGGMGPAATASFYSELISRTPANADQEHIPVVMWADPTVPDRSAALLSGGASVRPWLERGVDELMAAGATTIVCPCNTAHAWLRAIAQSRGAALLDIVDVTSRAIKEQNINRVGVLATDATVHASLYQDTLDSLGVRWVVPDARAQADVMKAVYLVKAGTADAIEEARAVMAHVTHQLRELGVDGVVTACTELGLVLNSTLSKLPQLDSVSELAQAAVERFLAAQAVQDEPR